MPDGDVDQSVELHAKARDHPGRTGMLDVQKSDIGIDRPVLRRKPKGEIAREHQTVDRHRRTRRGTMQRGSQAHEAWFVDRVGRCYAMRSGQFQPVARVAFGVGVDDTILALRNIVIVGDIERPRIHDSPFDKAGTRQLPDSFEALSGGQRSGSIRAAGERQCPVAYDVGTRANAFDDRSIDLIGIALSPALRIIWVEMDDRGPLLRAGQRLGDDLVGLHGNIGLQGAGPWPIERDFQPDGFHHPIPSPHDGRARSPAPEGGEMPLAFTVTWDPLRLNIGHCPVSSWCPPMARGPLPTLLRSMPPGPRARGYGRGSCRKPERWSGPPAS